LSERTEALGVGTDISEGALATAKRNAVGLGYASRAGFVACNYASALKGPFDLVVSNPPYIRSADIADLAEEVRAHDPFAALHGGTDGLDAYRALIPQAVQLLRDGGALVVEAGYDQSRQIEGLMTTAGLTVPCAPKADLAGIPRAVGGRKMPR
jgi:release factor glutamine methyltransferase